MNSENKLWLYGLGQHELAKRGFFTCSGTWYDCGIVWQCEDWTKSNRQLTVYGSGVVIGKQPLPNYPDQGPAEHLAAQVNTIEDLVTLLDKAGWVTLEESPVPGDYFPVAKEQLTP